jgi:DNA-binding response OmpR family regulator
MQTLIADDDDLMRLLLETVVRSAGHDVVAVSDGAAAWAEYQRGRHPLVLLDWQMPNMDGLEVCRRIRAFEKGDETFVMLVTARDSDQDLRSVLDAGADDYLSKPVTPENVRARLSIAERRIELARSRRSVEAQLAESRWLAGMGATTLALQHEINNPLAALLGNASLIATGLLTPAEERDALVVIVEQSRRIADVVKRLSALREPRTVEYVEGSRMLDLGKRDA